MRLRFASLLSIIAIFSTGVGRITAAETTYLPYTLNVTPEIKKAFQGTDSIEVRAVIGSASRFEVGGTYRVVGVCRQEAIHNAVLYVGNTATSGSAAITTPAGSSLTKKCDSGLTPFDVTFTLLRPGLLHITIYDLDNANEDSNVYAGIYLGEAVSPL